MPVVCQQLFKLIINERRSHGLFRKSQWPYSIDNLTILPARTTPCQTLFSRNSGGACEKLFRADPRKIIAFVQIIAEKKPGAVTNGARFCYFNCCHTLNFVRPQVGNVDVRVDPRIIIEALFVGNEDDGARIILERLAQCVLRIVIKVVSWFIHDEDV